MAASERALSPERKQELDRLLREIDAAIVFCPDEIVPIPARCKRGHNWVGRDAIRAPSLRGCCCFWCGAELRPHPDFPRVVDALTKRLAQPQQLRLAALDRPEDGTE